MLRLFRSLSAGFWVPFLWTLLTIFLLCLPGDDFPDTGDIFKIENFDKLVHLVLFGGIVLLWGTYAHLRQPDDRAWFKSLVGITLAVIVLGIAMEYVQLYLVSNRDFDNADISADTAGCLAAFGYLIMVRGK
jgi:hypothetical protein